MRWFLIIFILGCVLFFGLLGWQGQKTTNRPIQTFPDMDHTYQVRHQKESDFFADGRSARMPIPGTVAMGYSVPDRPVSEGGKVDPRLALDDSYYATGLFGEFFGEGFPEEFEVDEAALKRGHQRYDIYCTVCHGASGDGKGAVGTYWMGGMLPPTANLVDGRVAKLPEGQIFHTITHGKGLMGAYGGNIPVNDRWAIVAYLRALQLSQKADANNPEVKQAFDAAPQAN